MTPVRFGCQALVVVTLVMLVSFPEQSRVRAGAFWNGRQTAGGKSDVAATAPRAGSGQRFLIGYGSASETRLGAQGAAALYKKLYENDVEARRRPAPQALGALGGKVNGIVGYVRGAKSAPVPFARVLLRNITNGKVEARGIADDLGRFAFLDVMPGGYVVEMVDQQDRTMGTSEVVPIALHELREAMVRNAGRAVLASFGGALRPAAQETVDAAAAQGVNRIAAPEQCASPPCSSKP